MKSKSESVRRSNNIAVCTCGFPGVLLRRDGGREATEGYIRRLKTALVSIQHASAITPKTRSLPCIQCIYTFRIYLYPGIDFDKQ